MMGYSFTELSLLLPLITLIGYYNPQRGNYSRTGHDMGFRKKRVRVTSFKACSHIFPGNE